MANASGVIEIKNPGTYYFYLIDDNNRKVYKPFTITSRMIDKNLPSISRYNIINDGANTYIEFSAKDNNLSKSLWSKLNFCAHCKSVDRDKSFFLFKAST